MSEKLVMRCRNLRRNLQYSSLENFLFSVMVGAGETFLPAFALAMGFSQATAGLLAALPFLAGSLLQLAAPYLIERVGSYRRWVVGLVLLQGLSFIPLAIFAVSGVSMSESLLYFVCTVYWACGLASGPAWSTWMSSLVPVGIRYRYFAKRNHVGQLGVLFGLVSGGVFLNWAKHNDLELKAFAVLFFISCVMRVASGFFLARHTERPPTALPQKRLSLCELRARFYKGNEGKLITFLLFYAVAVHSSAPFYNPFMLEQLKLSYLDYMGLLSISFLSKIAAFAWLAHSRNTSHPLRLMKLGVFGASFLPAMWMVSSNYLYLSVSQVLSGLIWAVYDLGVTLLLFNQIRDDERTSFLSYYNFASALMILFGTGLGALVLKTLNEGPRAYMIVFGVSSLGRFLSFFYISNLLRKLRPISVTPIGPPASSSPPPDMKSAS